MQYLLSLPTNLVSDFHYLERKSPDQWFVASDPENSGLGSGGGTAYLLNRCWQEQASSESFQSWIEGKMRILIHAGGKSRRLPAYASTGKILTPIPAFRWKKGQTIDQKLLDIQVPFYEKILKHAPKKLNTLVASGDILILNEDDFGPIPEVDILVFGTWTEAAQASRHGVFFCHRNKPDELAFILQKPSVNMIQELIESYYFLMDVGVWLLSPKAVSSLMTACGWDPVKQKFSGKGNVPSRYDLYGEFSRFLGNQPQKTGVRSNDLTTAVVPLKSGSFYHYGTSRELIESTYRIQNKVTDQREIWHKRIKPHPNIFVMNSVHKGSLDSRHHNIWIENSVIPSSWTFSYSHIFTGIYDNQWKLNVSPGVCLDMVPVDNDQWCIRPYGLEDTFQGEAGELSVSWLNEPVVKWFDHRQIGFEEAGIDAWTDIYEAPLFPVVNLEESTGGFIQWMLNAPDSENNWKQKWILSRRLSAAQIQIETNLKRLYSRRKELLTKVLPAIANNHNQSVFYQLDLDKLSDIYIESALPLPDKIGKEDSLMSRIHNRMFLSRILKKTAKESMRHEEEAFALLREGIIQNSDILNETPLRNVLSDQIVWARSPVRLDLAGGWSDTPPYCIMNGGRVMNMAVELNGQPPVQVYITPTENLHIRIKSIDLGLELHIREYADLEDYNMVGSGFAIAKVSLMLSGFYPGYGASYTTLKDQLEHFGGGFDISLLAAVPKGSGLGTSSILAATILGALSEYCGLKSDHITLGKKTLILEQMLTTGGGWQDQYGGILPGVKIIETAAGFDQVPEIRWLPDYLFKKEEYRSCMLLYYTGVTRVAKNILGEIVRHMFLNHQQTLALVSEIKSNAERIAEAVRKSSWEDLNRCVELSWELNQQLDSGTNPETIQNILSPVEYLLLSKKLLGAGGGGYLFLIAKDPDAVSKVKAHLTDNAPNNKARFVDFRLSEDGLSITRS